MIPLDEPVRGARKAEHLRCRECGGSVRWTARVRTPAGYAAVERYRCRDCGHRGRQKVSPNTSPGFECLDREYEGVRPEPGRTRDAFHRRGFLVSTPDDECDAGRLAD